MIANEGYLAKRLDRITTEYEREMAAAAQLHGLVRVYLTAHGTPDDEGGLEVAGIPVMTGWEMDIDKLDDPANTPFCNRYGDRLKEHIALYFWPTAANPALRPANGKLGLIVCTNGVVDSNTNELLTAGPILSLHDDMTIILNPTSAAQ